jgi:hypothetical protein
MNEHVAGLSAASQIAVGRCRAAYRRRVPLSSITDSMTLTSFLFYRNLWHFHATAPRRGEINVAKPVIFCTIRRLIACQFPSKNPDYRV